MKTKWKVTVYRYESKFYYTVWNPDNFNPPFPPEIIFTLTKDVESDEDFKAILEEARQECRKRELGNIIPK